MSFFESIERMKRKLESYGHQNFIKQFSEEHRNNDTANVAIGTSQNTMNVMSDLLISPPSYCLPFPFQCSFYATRCGWYKSCS